MKIKSIGKLWPLSEAVNIASVLGVAVLVAGLEIVGMNTCLAADTDATQKDATISGTPLRVGITPEYPPLVFRKADVPSGAEIDFAKALGQELGRPVEFVVLQWDELIGYLVDRRIDIIMSGMSVTKARQLRISFSDPYVHNELRAIFPLKAASQFKSKEDILKTKAKIGVITGTTAEVFVKQNCTNAQIVNFKQRKDVAFFLLKGHRMDLFVDDTFALADMFSQNEADMAYLPEALSEDDLAWGIRSDDPQFLARVNSILSKWKADGTLDRTLNRWMPYLKNLHAKSTGGETK